MARHAQSPHETSFLLLETFARDHARLLQKAAGSVSRERIEHAYSAAHRSTPSTQEEATRVVTAALGGAPEIDTSAPTEEERLRYEDLLLTLSALADLAPDERLALCLHAAGYDERVSCALFGMRAKEERALHARAAERLVERAADTELGKRRECGAVRRHLVLGSGRRQASRRTERHVLTCPSCPGFLEVFDYQARLLEEEIPQCLRTREGDRPPHRQPILPPSRAVKIGLAALLVGALIAFFAMARGGSEPAPSPPPTLLPASPYVAPTTQKATKAAAPRPAARPKRTRLRPAPSPTRAPAPRRVAPPPRRASSPSPPGRPAIPPSYTTGPELEFGP